MTLALARDMTIPPKQPFAKTITGRQKLFAEALLANGGNKSAAARAAGAGQQASRVAGQRMARNPKVQAYLAQLVNEHLTLGSVVAVRTLVRLAGRAKSQYVQLEAAKDVLDRNAVGRDARAPRGAVGLTVVFNLAPQENAPIRDLAINGAGVENPPPLEAKPLTHRVELQKPSGLIEVHPVRRSSGSE